ncbi:kinesin-like protein KIN-10B isoform X4 [Canna indica]|uniref:Kinesin-like protein KIN-10B isoform X4 n=1 Tax=Canna indica TaxID=4628 RepID=A0AAQ3Q5Z3_9LILI|nr:kinesin-like protein KIN-10B isoform X4 [Canna indica]
MDSPSVAGGSMDSSASMLSNQLRKGVRVVGKIRPFLDSEIGGPSGRDQISVTRSDEHALVGLGEQSTSRKDSYKLDWCYNQDEDIDHVYRVEVKPLIEGLFCGRNACVVAYGTRGSGKSQLIQGSEENPGLAMMAIGEILAIANEMRGFVTVSSYEVSQDHIYDILEPKEQEVLILEDAARKIQVRGLSQVPVNSISDFKKLYFHGCNTGKACQKLPDDTTTRNHRGLIIYLSLVDNESNKSLVGKIGFVSLADYEDVKQKGNVKSQLAESSKINKSLYALSNIVYALNAGENFIPYRESKLTRMLQDCLCKTSTAVVITCLNPFPCQDTVSILNLASRSCQVANQHRHYSAKVTKSGSRFGQSFTPSTVAIRKMPMSVKKNEFAKCTSIEKKGYTTPSTTNRRWFEKLGSSVKTPGSRMYRSTGYKENVISSTLSVRYDDFDTNKQFIIDDTIGKTVFDERPTAVAIDSTNVENQPLLVKENPSSPPLSERLREISNSLKLLSTKTNSIQTPKSGEYLKKETTEPKTPGVSFPMRLDNESKFEYIGTPREVFETRSTGLKGIGEKRAAYILELREESHEPFKNMEDLRELGLSRKQVT